MSLPTVRNFNILEDPGDILNDKYQKLFRPKMEKIIKAADNKSPLVKTMKHFMKTHDRVVALSTRSTIWSKIPTIRKICSSAAKKLDSSALKSLNKIVSGKYGNRVMNDRDDG